MDAIRGGFGTAMLVAAALAVGGCERPPDGSPAVSDREPPAVGLEAEVDAYLQPYLTGGNFSGTVLVARDGEVLLDKGYGDASIESGAPNSPDTQFHIASVSKSFTAAAVLRLADQGELSLDDPLSRFAPDHPGGDQITLHHLLTHTSGISDINRSPAYTALSQSRQTATDLELAVRDLERTEPGGRYSYSNSNYNLLAYVIEQAGGTTYGDYVQAELLEPLGMESTGHDDGTVTLASPAVGTIPAEVKDVRPAPTFDWSVKTGNGSLYSTTGDLLLWAASFDSDDRLSPAAREAIFTPQVGDRTGYGWFLGEKFGRRTQYINGNSPGFSAFLGRYGDGEVIVVVLANHDIPRATSIGHDLAAMVYGEPYELPYLPEPLPASEVDLAGVEGEYVFPYWQLDVSAREGALYMRSGWPRYEGRLIPVGPDAFFHRFYWDTLELTRDETGAVVSAHWRGSPDNVGERKTDSAVD